jgi:hypothetical protein
LFYLIDKNGDKKLSWDELYAFDVLEVVRKFPLFFAPSNADNNSNIPIDDDVNFSVSHEEL